MDYYVRSNLSHDGKGYAVGSIIQLSTKVATPLLDAGVLSLEPIANTEPAKVPVVERQPEPKAGGERVESGEPSIDTPKEESKVEATDITPVVDAVVEPAKDPSLDL